MAQKSPLGGKGGTRTSWGLLGDVGVHMDGVHMDGVLGDSGLLGVGTS